MALMTSAKFLILVCAVQLCLISCVDCGYIVWITDNGPIVQGGTITFQAELFSTDGSIPQGRFQFNWKDNTLTSETWTDDTYQPRSTWNVTYDAKKYYPGEYEVQVNVDKFEVLFWYNICSRRSIFNITGFLNGKMEMIQGSPIKSHFVSNATQVEHEIVLSNADSAFLKNATEVFTYWFIDCVFYGESTDFSFNYSYGKVGINHSVEALVVASFEPIVTTTTPPTTTTTSTTPAPSTTTITSSSSTSTTPSTSTSKDAGSAALNSNEVSLIAGQKPINRTLVHVPYVCLNSSIIPPDPKKTYGYFQRLIDVRSPVHDISIKGTNWLQQYEVLDLQVICSGSGNFSACNFKMPVDYKPFGNETCSNEVISDTCQFNVSNFLSFENYTVVVILSNDVSKVIYPISVILYKVQKHAQLSVIVVPVVCSLIAVILIVFGVAYYVQRRKRFTVEVADFDFGQGIGDMEYKTFRERLREAVVNSLNRDFGVDGEGNVWSPSRKYGSMQ